MIQLLLYFALGFLCAAFLAALVAPAVWRRAVMLTRRRIEASVPLTLDEIRALIELRDSPAQDCGEINALLDEHIGHVAQRIRELRVLERDLKALRARCTSPHAVAECGILSGLDHASVSKPLSPNWPHLHGTH